jgi:hypothetical protein
MFFASDGECEVRERWGGMQGGDETIRINVNSRFDKNVNLFRRSRVEN